MNTKKINDIKVHDFVDLSPSKETMRAIEIAQAKELLKSAGYFVDNLWQTEDVKMNHECTEEQAHIVLFEAFNHDNVQQLISELIWHVAKVMNLKPID